MCFRTRQGLPFAALRVIDLLLRSAIARANRGGKVEISHMVWMGNHVHLFIRVLDAVAFRLFYMETQKKITDYIKRLLGRKYLTLWQGKPQVAQVLDVEKAIERIVYFYTNPSSAHLVESISEHPLLNTWTAFTTCAPDLQASYSEKVPWVRLPALKKLRSRTLTASEDKALTEALTKKSKRTHDYRILPNSWMKAFGIKAPEEIGALNDRIQQRVAYEEERSRKERALKGHGVVGRKRLRQQQIMAPHEPKKRERRNFVLASCAIARKEYIKKVRELFSYCRELYRQAQEGHFVIWPPGVYPAAVPPLANALA